MIWRTGGGICLREGALYQFSETEGKKKQWDIYNGWCKELSSEVLKVLHEEEHEISAQVRGKLRWRREKLKGVDGV